MLFYVDRVLMGKEFGLKSVPLWKEVQGEWKRGWVGNGAMWVGVGWWSMGHRVSAM